MNNFLDPKMLGLLGAAQGLLQASGPQPYQTSFGQAMGQGIQGGINGLLQGQQMHLLGSRANMEDQQLELQKQQLMRQMEGRQLLQSTIVQQANAGKTDPRSLGNALIATGHPDLIAQGLNFLKAAPKAKSAVKVMQNGQAVYQPLMDTGEFGQAGGMPAAEKLMQINQGSQIGLVNPYTGQMQGAIGVGITPGQSAQLAQSANQFNQSHGLAVQKALMELNPEFQARKAELIAGGKERGQMQAKAISDLPSAIQQGNDTIKLVDDLLQHPGFDMSVGGKALIGKALSFVPGTQEASFDIALNQLKGKQFLEAFQSLKGGGAITEIEGQKATQAMSRMEKANTQEEFTKAAREFQGIVQQGVNRAKMKAGITDMNQPAQEKRSVMTKDGFSAILR